MRHKHNPVGIEYIGNDIIEECSICGMFRRCSGDTQYKTKWVKNLDEIRTDPDNISHNSTNAKKNEVQK